MKSIKKSLAALLAGALLLAPAAACSNGSGEYVEAEKTTPVEYKSVYFDFLGGKDVMPIGGFFGPYVSHEVVINCENFPDYFSDDIFQKIADSGVNAIVYYNTVTEEATTKLLEQGEKFGVGIFVKDEGVNALLDDYTAMAHTFVPEDIDMNEFGTRMRAYAAYDSCLGLHVRDEAFTYHLDELKGIFDAYNSLGFHNKHVISNTIGNMGPNNVYTGWQYVIQPEEYYDMFFETGSTTFSTTMYPFDETDEDKALENMLDGLSTDREMALDYGVAFWRMLQAGAQWNDAGNWIESAPEPYPTEGQMLLDINAALTYGAKAIQYFPLIQPTWFSKAEDYTRDYDRNGLIAANGEPTRWYYYAQKANKQIAAVDHVLMNSANLGVIVHGDYAAQILGDTAEHPEYINGSFRQLTSVSGGDALVGCFDYNGGTALYITNFNTTEKQQVTLHFDNSYAYEVIQRAQSANVYGNAITLTLEAGEGALVVVK